MGILNNLLARFSRGPSTTQERAPLNGLPNTGRLTAGVRARPTYVRTLAGNALLSREDSFALLHQFYRAIPALPRAVDILAGFAGVPKLVVEGNDAETKDLQDWADRIPFGDVGFGLRPFLRDHLGQTLLYGFGVGEMEIAAGRREIDRLWSYRSPYFGFRTDTAGELTVVQRGGVQMETPLDPMTALVTVHNPQGADPNGQGLFQSTLNYCQLWVDMTHAHRSAWNRIGDPTLGLHYKPPATLNDPDGVICAGIKDDLDGVWAEIMRSKVVDGQTKDLIIVGDDFNALTFGADGQMIDFTASKRATLEEIIAATGIPAFMFGYTWATTERMSKQQADALLSTVDLIRFEAEGTIRKIVDLRQRLQAKRAALNYKLAWPDVTLQDLLQSAQAALAEANALNVREQVNRRLWQTGVLDQEGYAEAVTGSTDIATEMDEPPSASPESNTPPPEDPTPAEERAAALLEMKAVAAEYGLPHCERC